MPSNIVSEIGPAEYPETVNIRGYKPSTGVHIGQIKKALEMLKNAKKPLFLIGDGVNISHANEEFEKLFTNYDYQDNFNLEKLINEIDTQIKNYPRLKDTSSLKKRKKHIL